MILDATAGNRHIWGKNKHPEGVIFFDKEPNLKIPADVLGTWDKLPFKDDSFDCIIFDPPHVTHFSETSLHLNPKEDGKVWGCWWGGFKGKNQMLRQIYTAQKEFARVSSRLCLKWNDNGVGIYPILSLFDRWDKVWIQPYVSNHYQRKSTTYWVKMVRRDGV